MLTTSSLYKSIFADPAHTVQWKITVNGTDYTDEQIAPVQTPRLARRLIDGDEPTIGQCIAATFSCAIYEASSAVPRMATVSVAYRLAMPLPEGSSDSPTVSEWITLGTTYIDTREVDKATQALILSCYDKMLVGNVTYLDVTGFDEWPQSQASVAAEIASIMGISLDSRTTLRTGAGYMVEYPNDLSCLEVLGYIGVANAGNWCITPANDLRLVPLTGASGSLDVGSAILGGLRTSPVLESWAGVIVYHADEAAYEAGDTSGTTGRVLTCECPWATQATADGILDAIEGHAYQPFSADGAVIDLALELGDSVTAGLTGESVSGPVFTIDVTGNGIEQANIAAPGDAEIDHEYPYASYIDRSLKRKVGLGQAYYGVTISRKNGLEIARSDGKSQALFNSDKFEMDALIDGVMTPRIYFDPIKGDYIFDGALGADAVFTDSLYAETGDVAELTVDRLSTSRRIRKYILGDTSDDNYVRIQDQYIQFVTGTLVPDIVLLTELGIPLLTEDGEEIMLENSVAPPPIQAKNRYNQPLYWQREPVGHTSDGYPTDADGVQIYAGTEQTDWPVMVFAYTELVKASFAFDEYTTSQGTQTYAPVIVLGAGDENGNSKGYFLKEQNEMIVRYLTGAGEMTDIRLSDFVDAKHRRLASCNIDTAYGIVTYTVEGDETEYSLTFEEDGDTVIYTWPDGFKCEVSIT